MSRLRANQITNENANGAPNFPHGLTVTGVVLFAVFKFNQIPNTYGIIGIILIIIGVVMVNYLGRIN